jgi:hypothetical protein
MLIDNADIVREAMLQQQPHSFRFADEPGTIGKRYAENWPVIASDLEVDPCQRYDSEGQDGRRPI